MGKYLSAFQHTIIGGVFQFLPGYFTNSHLFYKFLNPACRSLVQVLEILVFLFFVLVNRYLLVFLLVSCMVIESFCLWVVVK
jgi:hypothetical protein